MIGIYKITNVLNNKCYIGQSIDIKTRWMQHIYEGKHNTQKGKLYPAMFQNGIENFTFEVLQDNIENFEQLDKAEIYWIDYYNSFIKGYNETFGGQQYHKILPNKEIIKDYYKTRSARKTALKFGISNNTVDDILNSNNIPRFTFRQAAGQRIAISKDNFYKEFDSVKDCAEWFVKNKICRTTTVESARTGLKDARRGNGYYYGYFIENI